MTLQSRKYKLIEEIMGLENESMLGKLEAILREYYDSMESIQHLIAPERKKTDVEAIVREQGFTGVNKEEIDRIIEEMAIEEPLEELLKML